VLHFIKNEGALGRIPLEYGYIEEGKINDDKYSFTDVRSILLYGCNTCQTTDNDAKDLDILQHLPEAYLQYQTT
jgi:hypothetical protein